MRIYVMVGNIGSGKTTLVKKILAKNPNIVVISRDDLRYMIGAGEYTFNPDLEPHIWEAATDMINSFMRGQVVDLLVDETNVSKGYREHYLYLAKKYGYEAVAIVMPYQGKKISVDRRMQDPHGQDGRILWEGVWEKFNALYEEPTEEEGFNEVIKGWEFGDD